MILLLLVQLPPCEDPLGLGLCDTVETVQGTANTLTTTAQSLVSSAQATVNNTVSGLTGGGASPTVPTPGGDTFGGDPLLAPPPPASFDIAFESPAAATLDRVVLHATASEEAPVPPIVSISDALLTADSARVVRARTEDDRRALEEIADRFRGTRDVAGAIEALRDVPFTWLRPEAQADAIRFIGLTPQEFVLLDGMTSWEFVHFVAWLAGDRPERVKPSASGGWVDLVTWEMGPGALAPGGAPERGAVLLGRGKLGGSNAGGYYQAAVALGDGTAAALTSDGVVVRAIDELFPAVTYERPVAGPYPWAAQPEAMPKPEQIQQYQFDVAWRMRP